MDKIKLRKKKQKIWLGGFPEEAQPMDLCIKKECGERGSLYYMIYINTPDDVVLPKRFVYLYATERRKEIQEHLGIRFPKGF